MKPMIALIVATSILGIVSTVAFNPSAEQRRPFEEAYFHGQRDALTGDIRIEFDEKHQCWRWTKTCWDSGAATTFDPSSSK